MFTPHLQVGLLERISPPLTVTGDEFAYLLNSGQLASIVFKTTGAIPLWNPFIARGEPLLENPFSFVFNPFMTLPMLLIDPVQGVDISIVLHIVLIGLGGWALAYVLGLGAPGRVVLALLLAGSGSLAMAVGAGFYQIGMSLAYIPWVITGLVGTLLLQRRWPICLLSIASMLMIFAGTFWYVLPVTVVAALVTIIFVIAGYIDNSALRRLGWALVVTIALSGIRLLPLLNSSLVSHLSEPLNTTFGLGQILETYLTPTTPPVPGFLYDEFAYHYILPFVAAVLLLIARLLIRSRGVHFHFVTISGLLIVVLFTIWAQEGTPLFRWLYQVLPALQQWRSPVRMGAIAAFWIAVLAAIWFDETISYLLTRSALTGRMLIWATVLGVCALLIGALVTTFDVLINWTRVVTIGPVYRRPIEADALHFLRQQHPDGFLSVRTEGIFGSFAFYDTLIRAATGNPNLYVTGLVSTIGRENAFADQPEYAVGIGDYYQAQLRAAGFEPVADAPRAFDAITIWKNPDSLPYAFEVDKALLLAHDNRLMRHDVRAISTFTHNIDSIRVAIRTNRNAVLVLQETAYPGWTVSINGQSARIESVSGLIGVLLPQTAIPIEVVFVYKPTLLYIGAAITLVGVIIFVGFALKLDRRITNLLLRMYCQTLPD